MTGRNATSHKATVKSLIKKFVTRDTALRNREKAAKTKKT